MSTADKPQLPQCLGLCDQGRKDCPQPWACDATLCDEQTDDRHSDAGPAWPVMELCLTVLMVAAVIGLSLLVNQLLSSAP
jgi:hypothetical protein